MDAMQSVTHPAALRFENLPMVMGIINCTPDSFFPASRKEILADALDTARRMIDEGSDILDVGGESSRPGAAYVEAEEELSRVIPVIEGIRSFSDIPVSVDTRKERVARAAFEAGADILNDISALADDPAAARTAAEFGAAVVLMHKRGTPEDMQLNPEYENTLDEIIGELNEAVARALSAGISRERIIIDPGLGFGKRHHDNLLILRNLDRFSRLGFPVLVGHSRKSFLERITGRAVDGRLAASIAAGAAAQLKGAAILRVHDVAATVDAVRVIRAIEGADAPWSG
jgi:dihydropteroate synthase